MNETLQYYIMAPTTELIAVFSSLAYVILAAHKNIWCWPAAIISTVLYTFLFYEVYLWMDSVLQLYYLAMAVYGWYCWRGNFVSSQTVALPLKKYKGITHIKAIVCLTVISAVIGFFMAQYTPTDFPYLDSATTVFAVFTTYLVTQKVVENWIYWVVIDALSIFLYIEKGLIPTASLFACFTLIAIYGYFSWDKEFNENNTMPSTA